MTLAPIATLDIWLRLLRLNPKWKPERLEVAQERGLLRVYYRGPE